MYSGKGLVALATIALWALLASGCADDSSTRSVVHVVSINNNMPLQSDVRDWGDDAIFNTADDQIADDVVEVTMANYPHDDALWLRPGMPFGDVIFTSYKVTFIRPDNNGGAPSSFSGVMNLLVPSAQENPNEYTPPQAYILLVPGGLKADELEPLDELAGTANQLSVEAYVEFFGTETASNDEVKTSGRVNVSFADYVDEEEEE